MPNNPYKEIAGIITGEARKSGNQARLVAAPELGVITASGLKLDELKDEIKDYLVLDYLTVGEEDMAATDGDHTHNVKTPESLKPLTVGNRVLVLQVGIDFIVIGRVV